MLSPPTLSPLLKGARVRMSYLSKSTVSDHFAPPCILAQLHVQTPPPHSSPRNPTSSSTWLFSWPSIQNLDIPKPAHAPPPTPVTTHPPTPLPILWLKLCLLNPFAQPLCIALSPLVTAAIVPSVDPLPLCWKRWKAHFALLFRRTEGRGAPSSAVFVSDSHVALNQIRSIPTRETLTVTQLFSDGRDLTWTRRTTST